MSQTETVEYEQRVIAFIDILGFKEIIRQSEQDTSRIALVHSVLEYLKELETSDNWTLHLLEIEEDAQKRDVDNFDVKNKINTTAFSDSIVVSVRVDSNVNEMASTLIVNLAYVGSLLLEKGILFRGGITIGNIIHKENGIVFGQGLIDAYMLETKSAKYPRLVLSDKLIKRLNYPIETKKDRYPYHQYIERFSDGCVGFHQMIYYQVIQSWTEMSNDKLKESLDKIRKIIISGLDTSFEHTDVFEKYNWLKEQYHKLIILGDYDREARTEENIKIRIRNLNENIAGQNIHFSYTDGFYEKKRDAEKGEIS